MQAKESIPFAPHLIESMRSLGYSFETALADLIDNSIGAQAKRIDIFLNPSENPHLIILDDGCGMEHDELEEALRYGSRSPLDKRAKDDLGRFGLGMKSASLSQCRKLTVVSKKNGNISCFSWDLDYILDKKGWLLLEYSVEEIKELPFIDKLINLESGTYLLLEKFDRVSSSTLDLNNTLNTYMNNAIEHISLVFHRFIDSGVKIFVNNKEIEQKDPFLVSNKATMSLREQELIIDGETIKIKPYILPYISKLTNEDLKMVGGKEDLKNNQGFYVYRNKRLIIWGTWFKLTRKEELGKLARVMVDIPSTLDYMWSIDIKKSSALLPDIIKKNLYACIEESVFKSKSVYEYRGRKEKNDDNINYIWERNILRDGYFEYKINRNIPQIKLFEESLDYNQVKLFEKILANIENCFPTSLMYLDASKGKVNIDADNVQEIDRLYNDINEQLDYCSKIGMDRLDVLKILLKTEPFCKCEKLKEKFDIGVVD